MQNHLPAPVPSLSFCLMYDLTSESCSAWFAVDEDVSSRRITKAGPANPVLLTMVSYFARLLPTNGSAHELFLVYVFCAVSSRKNIQFVRPSLREPVRVRPVAMCLSPLVNGSKSVCLGE